MLGYVRDTRPNQAGILASSVIRGATHRPLDGLYIISPSHDRTRLASKKDFDAFHVSFDGYNNPAVYEFVTV